MATTRVSTDFLKALLRLTYIRDPQNAVHARRNAARAYVRAVKAADVLLSFEPAWTERLLLRLVKALYQHRLRELVKELPPAVSAKILSASENMMWAVRGFTNN